MKKFLIILCCMIGMAVHAQTTMDILTSTKIWVSKDISNGYSYCRFERTFVTEGEVLLGKSYANSYLFYLSDTEDTVFDSSKVGKSNTGRYIVINYPDEPVPHVDEIVFLDSEKLVTKYDSKGKYTPWVSTFTLYARTQDPPVPRRLVETVKGNGVDYMPWGYIFSYPADEWKLDYQTGCPYHYSKPMPLKSVAGHVTLGYYAWSNGEMESRRLYDMLDVHGAAWARYKSANFMSPLVEIGGAPGADVLAPFSDNGYFMEVPCANCTLVVAIAFQSRVHGDKLVIFALTSGGVRIVYEKETIVRSVESIERGKFHMTTSRGRIYEKGGQVWVEE